MKFKILLTAIPIFLAILLRASILPVNDKVLKVFKETFSEAKDISWFESKDTYTVHFIRDDIRYNVIYGKDGQLINMRRYYRENNLPLHIMLKIRKKFPEKTIYGITETMDSEGTNYYINLEGKNCWWVVRVYPGDWVEVTHKFIKTPPKD